MKNTEQNRNEKTERKHHFMYFVLRADQKENPMPKGSADSVLKKLLDFFCRKEI
jgi:hypothetical protein